MQGPTLMSWDLSSSREDELGDLGGDRDPVSLCPAVFSFCAFGTLSLLFLLKSLFHCGTNLLLQIVVVVGRELALDLGCCLSNGIISCSFADSHAAASMCQADLAQHRVLPVESSDSDLVEGSCDHHDDSSQSSEMTTI